MIHHNIFDEIKKRKQHDDFIYPDYGTYSIAEIPSSVLRFFDIKHERPVFPGTILKNPDNKYKKLLFFFIDGFGYDHFLEYEKDLPFFHTLKEKADVYPITSVFPSTTAAALTALHTGLTPQEHGLPEWTVYLEELERISFGTLKEHEGKPEMLYEGPTLYQKLKDQGITSYIFTYEAYYPSSYSHVTQEGAITIPFRDLEDLFPKLLEALAKEKGQAYFFVYWGDVDSTEHLFGPKSNQHIAALKKIENGLRKEFAAKLTPDIAENTMFFISSDHGQVNIRDEEIIYLNSYIDLDTSYYRPSPEKTIFPTGAPHDVFLHIYWPKVESTLKYLKKQLSGKAEIITTTEALSRNLFGLGVPIARFLKRIGDLLILPFAGYHVWYQHTPFSSWKQLGIHGGLSKEEMMVPLIVTDLVTLMNSQR